MADLMVALRRAVPDPGPLSFYSMHAGMTVEEFEHAFEFPNGWRHCFTTSTGTPDRRSCHISASASGLGRRLGVPGESMRILLGTKEDSSEIDSFVITRMYPNVEQLWDEYRHTVLRWSESGKKIDLRHTRAPTSKDDVCDQLATIEEPEFSAKASTSCMRVDGREYIQLMVLLARR